MRKTAVFGVFLLILAVALVSETLWLKRYRSLSQDDINTIQAYTQASGVYLPAFYNETPYSRHSIFADDTDVFSFDPLMEDTSLSSLVYSGAGK